MNSKNYLQSYIEYATEITDSPIIYHEFVAYSTVSTVIGSNVFFNFGDLRVYPNLWIILLAQSSFYRKSTAIGIGVRVLRRVNENFTYPQEFTQEKILEVIEQQPQGVFIFYEFLSLLGLLSKDYNAGLKAFLTEIYDSPYSYHRQTVKKTFNILRPSISILSASTIEWFLEKTREGDLLGGFLPRFLFITPQFKEKNMAFPPPMDMNKCNDLVDELHSISLLHGEAHFSPEAIQLFSTWHVQFESQSLNDPLIASFLSRYEMYALKLAVIIEIIKSHSLNISLQTMNNAIQIIKFLSNQLRSLLDEEFVFTKFDHQRKKVLKYIKAAGEHGITRSRLLKSTHISAGDLNNVVKTLNESLQIQCVTIQTQEGSKPQLVYKYVKDNK